MRSPRVFTIPAGCPFLPTLADALLSGALLDGWPAGVTLADATVYLPTRRAGRLLGSILAERSEEGLLLLPRIVPLGDADEIDPPALPGAAALPTVPALERRLVLTRLVQAWASRIDRDAEHGFGAGIPFNVPGSPADAVGLAGELEALMDSFATEGVDWSALDAAVDLDMSRFYRLTLDFVRIAHEAWPAILAGRAAGDPARTRTEALLAEAARLRRDPPAGPVIAAGSTGSVSATAVLLDAIARLPNGAVVLPGLDTDLDPVAWEAVGGEGPAGDGPIYGHAQFMLRRLVHEHLRIDRPAVRRLGPPEPEGLAARRRLVSEVLRPAGTTESWAAWPAEERVALARAGTEDVALLEAGDEREEALAIAIALRETLARPGATAALVTPEPAPARRVAAEMARWGVAIADSAPVPLSDTPAGRLARLAAEAAAADFAPVPLLALLAHPDVTLGRPRPETERHAAALEIGVLRGPAPAAGLSGIAAALDLRRLAVGRRDPLPRQQLAPADWDGAADLLGRLGRAFAGFAPRDGEIDLLALSQAHCQAVDALRETPPGQDPGRDPAAAAVASLFEELSLCLAGSGADARIAGRFRDYPAFFAALARERSGPPDRGAGHPRLAILGLLEARLLHHDRVVLGGLDEGIWPPAAQNDAFLNRPMRLAIGLTPPERRIGQTAHDFAQALGTPDVVLTRARKRGGKPTVPSRLLERLRAFAGEAVWSSLRAGGDRYLGWAAALDRPQPVRPARRPAPRPGGARFPRRLSVTEVETLVRDPYSIYARHVLRLTALDPLAVPPSAAERGSILHDILGGFAGAVDGPLPPGAAADLLGRGREAFAGIARAHPELHALWWPAFERLVPDYLAWETERRQPGHALAVERSGSLPIPLAGGETFLLTGRADRIEHGPGGTAIIDFKTGAPPTDKVIAVGFSPQLTLEAAMLRAGGFAGVPAAAATPALLYVKLGGRDNLLAREVKPPKDGRSLTEMIDAHLDGLIGLLRRYVEEGAGFLSRPYPQHARRFSDYDHLARVREWSATGGDEGPSA